MSSDVNKAAVKTLPGTAEISEAVAAAQETIDASALEGKYCSIESVGGTCYVLAFKTQALADAATVATSGADKGWEFDDGVPQDFMITDNKKFLRVIGSGALTLYIYDTSTK